MATIWTDLSMIVVISTIISTGPNIQEYLYLLINSDAAGIYESAYQTQFSKLPGLKEWLEGALYWPFIAMAAIIVICSFGGRSVRRIFDFLAISSFLTLSVVDVVSLSMVGDLSKEHVFKNIIANFIGAITLAFVTIVILIVSEYCYKALSGPRLVRQVAVASFSIVQAAIVSTSVYYALDFFYRPLPVRIAMALDYKSSGTLIAEETDPEPKTDFEGKAVLRPPFSFVPPVDINASANWRSPQGTTRVQWSALGTPAKFDAEVSLYGECWDGRKLPQNNPRATYHLADIRDVEFWVDSGLFQFDILNDQQSSGVFNMSPERIVSFSTSRSEDDKNIELEHLVHEKATLSYSSSNRTLTYYAIAAPFSMDGEEIKTTSTTLHLKADGEDHQIKLETQNKASRDHKLARLMHDDPSERLADVA